MQAADLQEAVQRFLEQGGQITQVEQRQHHQDAPELIAALRQHRHITEAAKACRWDVSVSLVTPEGIKAKHSFTIQSAWMFDLVGLVNEQIHELINENGDRVTGAGWEAHGRGTPKPKKRKRR